jgi:hypothetical protein
MSFNPFDFASAGGLVKTTENISELGKEFLAEFPVEVQSLFRDPVVIKSREVRDQMEELKKQGKTEEAKKLFENSPTIAHHIQMVKGGQGRLGAEKLEILSGMFVTKLQDWYLEDKLPNNKWGVRRISYTVTNGRATNGIGDFSFYLGATSSEVAAALKESIPASEEEESVPKKSRVLANML